MNKKGGNTLLLLKIKAIKMNLQADIAWVQQEVGKISNPRLIEAFKALLLYREENLEEKKSKTLKEKLLSRALRANEDLTNNRIYTKEEVILRTNKHLGL